MSQAAWGDYVRYDDYAALESDLAKLRAGQEPVAYTTAGMLAIAKELPLTGRIGARCKADDRWNVPLYTTPQPSAVPGNSLTGEYHADVNRLMVVNQQLLEALEHAVSEYEKLPHSLGYEFTHLPSMRAAIAAARKEGGKV